MARTLSRRLALILAAAILPACQDNGRNAVVPGTEAMGAVSPVTGTFASWSRDVWPILQIKCRGCHTTGVGATQVPDMRMTDSSALYLSWVRILSKCNRNLYRILPGQVELSFVWDKIAHPAPMCGERMPLEGAPLDSTELATIRLWIEQGAPHD